MHCTVVEFEWDEDFDHEGFRRMLGRLSEESPSPAGLLSRITGIDASGARVIEVWRSGGDPLFLGEPGQLLVLVVVDVLRRAPVLAAVSVELLGEIVLL